MISASGSVGQAIILFEAALGLGIAAGPLSAARSARSPGAARSSASPSLMRRPRRDRVPAAEHPGRGGARRSPTRSARCATRGLLTIALTALFYNLGFFTLLAFTPFPLDLTATRSA